MLKKKSEFKQYLITELNWLEKDAEEWCNYLVIQGLLQKED